MNLPQSSPLANLPLAELEHSLATFLEPPARLLPDWPLVVVLHLALRGLLAGREPVIFDQEDGLRVESMQVVSLERLRRPCLPVLPAAAFAYRLEKTWLSAAVRWLRRPGGKLGLGQDRDGPYLLAGISAVLSTWATLSFAALQPFPHEAFSSYG